MRPLAWRPRHDAFAEAVSRLRLAAPQGPAEVAVASLSQALAVHVRYEEDVLLPRYAEVAPEEGPGSLRALHRDHRLIEGHLAHAAAADPLVRAWSLARLEGVLEHHDLREATHVLPALEELGVDVDITEPDIVHAPLESSRVDPTAVAPDWPTALRWLASGHPCTLPPVHDHPKAARLAQAYEAALRKSAEGELAVRRDGVVQAFDRALDLAWCAGQARADWVQELRGLTGRAPTTRP